MRRPREVELPLTLDRTSSRSLSQQLVSQVRELVARGVLRAGDPLPATRTLAARLGISRGTVVAAWDELTGEGYLLADRGATRIAPDLMIAADAAASPPARPAPGRTLPAPAVPSAGMAPAAGTAPSARTSSPARTASALHRGRSGVRTAGRPRSVEGEGLVDLRPGRAAIAELDTPAWRGAWRDAASGVVNRSGGASHAHAELTEHLANYVRVTRGVMRDADEVVVTAGARDGLQLVLGVLARTRGRGLRVAVENPGYAGLRGVVTGLGHAVVPVAVDEHGLDPAALPRSGWGGPGVWDVSEAPDAVVVTPGHQYPLGGTMPVSRRLELLRWAREHGAVVIEDDYDSELRDTGQPLPALGALDTARDTVVTLGSFTKVLGNAVGVGHLIAPDEMLPELRAHRAGLGSPVSAIAQAALAELMARGELQRHTARMRRAFRARRALVRDVLGSAGDRPDGTRGQLGSGGPEPGGPEPGRLAGVRVLPMAGGAHAVVEVPDEAGLIDAARARGVLVSGLAQYWVGSRAANPGAIAAEGLVLGLGASNSTLHRGLTILRDLLTAPLLATPRTAGSSTRGSAARR